MKILIFVLIFLLVSAFLIISNNELALRNSENLSKFTSLYGIWLKDLGDNSVKFTGYVAKMDWLPKE
ncbi:MAG: hypothetical protein WC796_02280 [Candidatus Pacearchaeota archaeon]|jgi:hypothetical protein